MLWLKLNHANKRGRLWPLINTPCKQTKQRSYETLMHRLQVRNKKLGHIDRQFWTVLNIKLKWVWYGWVRKPFVSNLWNSFTRNFLACVHSALRWTTMPWTNSAPIVSGLVIFVITIHLTVSFLYSGIKHTKNCLLKADNPLIPGWCYKGCPINKLTLRQIDAIFVHDIFNFIVLNDNCCILFSNFTGHCSRVPHCFRKRLGADQATSRLSQSMVI